MNNKPMFNLVAERKRIINKQLSLYLSKSQNKLIKKVMGYASLNGGHKWRPILLILTYETFKPFSRKILPVACAIEIIHNLSLILDDLPCMDNAKYRRNKKTTHLVFGEDISVLMGPYMTSLSYGLLPQDKRICNEFSNAIAKIVFGQIEDLRLSSESNIKDIISCYEKKAGALFICSAKMGGLLTNATHKDLHILELYGKYLGVAYQIYNDLKDKGSKKINLRSILGESEAKKKAKEYIRKARKIITKLSTNPKILTNFLNCMFYE